LLQQGWLRPPQAVPHEAVVPPPEQVPPVFPQAVLVATQVFTELVELGRPQQPVVQTLPGQQRSPVPPQRTQSDEVSVGVPEQVLSGSVQAVPVRQQGPPSLPQTAQTALPLAVLHDRVASLHGVAPGQQA
jgi:hypothetical protein